MGWNGKAGLLLATKLLLPELKTNKLTVVTFGFINCVICESCPASSLVAILQQKASMVLEEMIPL